MKTKIRAWHKKQNRMFDVYSISRDYVTEDTLDGISHGTNIFDNELMEDLDLMENRGLTDKKKADLFENDIVVLESYYQKGGTPHDPDGEEFHYTYIGVVKYTPSLGYHLKIKSQYCEFKGEYVVPAKIKSIVQYRCEKIGNIYEHPELLEKKA